MLENSSARDSLDMMSRTERAPAEPKVALPAGFAFLIPAILAAMSMLGPVTRSRVVALGLVLLACGATLVAQNPRTRHNTGPERFSRRVLATGLGFMLDGTYGVLDAKAEVLLPYLAAGAAAWLWTRPPKPRKVKASEDEGT